MFFSVSTYPEWLQAITQVLPLTQLNTAMRELIFDSVGFANLGQLGGAVGVLAAWCVATLIFARLRFKW